MSIGELHPTRSYGDSSKWELELHPPLLSLVNFLFINPSKRGRWVIPFQDSHLLCFLYSCLSLFRYQGWMDLLLVVWDRQGQLMMKVVGSCKTAGTPYSSSSSSSGGGSSSLQPSAQTDSHRRRTSYITGRQDTIIVPVICMQDETGVWKAVGFHDKGDTTCLQADIFSSSHKSTRSHTYILLYTMCRN